MTWTCRTCKHTITATAQHCPACHETFTGTSSGDMHRTGHHGVTDGPNRRRCLTTDEMTAKGMTLNKRGHWTTGQEFESAAESFNRLPQTA